MLLSWSVIVLVLHCGHRSARVRGPGRRCMAGVECEHISHVSSGRKKEPLLRDKFRGVNPGESDSAFASKTSLEVEVNVTWGLGLEVYDCAVPWTDSFKGRESRAALWQRYISLSNLHLVYGC
jgi:hypothetical protein